MPRSQGSSAITYFELLMRQSGSLDWQTIVKANVTEAKISNLMPGRVYFYEVRAISADGPSKPAELKETASFIVSAPQIKLADVSRDSFEL